MDPSAYALTSETSTKQSSEITIRPPTLDEITQIEWSQGIFKIFHMPVSLKMSQEVFQMQMDQITNRFPGIIALNDDICVYGKDTAELQLMQTATKQGLVFSSSKCAICQCQISFYCAIFTVQCMQPDPAKVQALQDLPAPENSEKLQLFLALINYLQHFLPGLGSKITLLREQVTNWE